VVELADIRVSLLITAAGQYLTEIFWSVEKGTVVARMLLQRLLDDDPEEAVATVRIVESFRDSVEGEVGGVGERPGG